MQTTSDDVLIRRIANGDRLAMQVLYARHHVRVYRFVLRFVRNEATAEDLISEVFLARLKVAQDDLPGAVAVLDEAEAFVRQHRFVFRMPDVTAARLLVLLRQGDLVAALNAYPANRQPTTSQAGRPCAVAQPLSLAPCRLARVGHIRFRVRCASARELAGLLPGSAQGGPFDRTWRGPGGAPVERARLGASDTCG